MEGLSAEPAKWPSRKKTMVESLAFFEGSTASLASTAVGVAAGLAAAGCCWDRAETGIRSTVERVRWMGIRISPRCGLSAVKLEQGRMAKEGLPSKWYVEGSIGDHAT